MNSFFIKYLKYKKKYSQIKKQVGGMREAKLIHTPSGRSISILLPDNLFCPLTKKPFVDPVVNNQGITYERSSFIEEFGEEQPIIPNINLKITLEELIEQAFIKKNEEIRTLHVKSAAGDIQAKRELALKYMSGDDILDKDINKAMELFHEIRLLKEKEKSMTMRDTFPQYDLHRLSDSVKTINELTKQCLSYPGFKRGPDMDWPTVQKRTEYCTKCGWSIPSTDVTKKIVEHVGKDCVLSLAAGMASQETLLAALGVKIVCTDIDPPPQSFMPVERLDNDQAVAKWRPHCEVAMLVWPEYICKDFGAPRGAPYPNCHTYEALLKGNFSKIIYIGEEDGCTGSRQLEIFLRENYNEVAGEWPPNWPGIHDSLRLFERKTDKVKAVPKP
jgi:hypothetical protein